MLDFAALPQATSARHMRLTRAVTGMSRAAIQFRSTTLARLPGATPNLSPIRAGARIMPGGSYSDAYTHHAKHGHGHGQLAAVRVGPRFQPSLDLIKHQTAHGEVRDDSTPARHERGLDEW